MSHLIRLESPLLLTKNVTQNNNKPKEKKKKKENNQGKTTQIFGREKVKKIKI